MIKSFAFSKESRIKRKKDFQILFQKSFRIYGGFFVFRIVPQRSTKIGIMVSKRFGNAVYRNSVKRKIREIFRHTSIKFPIHILIMQRSPIKKMILAEKEIRFVFRILSDPYTYLQIQMGDLALKNYQKTHKNLSFLAQLMCRLIFLYRKYLSPTLNRACRFEPSCSMYSYEAYRVFGFWKGTFLMIKRLLSCHPFGGSGYDPIPKKKHQSR